MKDVKELEAADVVAAGTTAELEQLLEQLYQPTVFDEVAG